MYFQKAALQGNADGNYYLGLMKLTGQGFPSPDPKGAFTNFMAATVEKHPKALLQLGLMKQFGVDKDQSYAKAKDFYKRAEQQKNTHASYYLGELYNRGLIEPDPNVSVLSLWEKAANSGHKEAAYKVGKIYFSTCLDTKNEETAKKAHQYLQQAAATHPDAIYLLALMHENGIGCYKNPIEAMKHYKQAADAGHASAQFKLGNFYETIFPPQYKEASKWYGLAANQHYLEAYRSLGKLFQEKYQALGKPFQEGYLTLGKSFQEDKELGLESASELAFFCFENFAKELGCSVLMPQMKQMLEGGSKDALGWFKNHAEQDNPHAQYYFAKLLETGIKQGEKILLPQDMSQAIEFYKKAKDQGNRSAQRRLDILKKTHLFSAI